MRKIVELMVGGILDETHRRPASPDGRRPTAACSRRLAVRRRLHTTSTSTVRPGEIVGCTAWSAPGSPRSPRPSTACEQPTGGRILLDGNADRADGPRGTPSARDRPAAGEPQGSRACSRSSPSRSTSPSGTCRCCPGQASGWTAAVRRRWPEDMITRLAVKTPSETPGDRAMSGGNAQKVVLARQLVERPGVAGARRADPGGRRRRQGGDPPRSSPSWPTRAPRCWWSTSDLREALRISDRLQVVRGGTTTVEFGRDATQVDVLAAAAGAVEADGQRTHRCATPTAEGQRMTPAPQLARTRPGSREPDPAVTDHRPGVGAGRRSSPCYG